MNPRRQRLAWVVIGVGVVVVIVVVIYAVLASALNTSTVVDRQAVNSKKIDSSAQALQIIKDCTTPGRPCYMRGQQRTAQVVGDINRANAFAAAAAAACADEPGRQSFTQIYACVTKAQAAAEHQRAHRP